VMHHADSIAGDDAESFVVYHFNGMRDGCLTELTLYRRSADNVIGQPTGLDALEQGMGGGFGGGRHCIPPSLGLLKEYPLWFALCY
jgi:hypothetical protein